MAGPTNLVITYDDVFGFSQVATALTNHGQSVDTIIKAAPGALATALGANNYTNVFLWDIGGRSSTISSTDLSALKGWYASHRDIVIDGRSYGAIDGSPFHGILGDEGVYLDNVANVFSADGGGLWIGADNDSTGGGFDWTLNADAALGALGYNRISGVIVSNAFFVDHASPIMAGVTGSNLLWPWSAGEVPTCLQPNGVTLRAIGVDDNGVPLISTNSPTPCNGVPGPPTIVAMATGALVLLFVGLRKRSA